MKRIKQWILPYRQALPALLLYQLLTSVVTSLWMLGFSQLCGLLIRGTGRVALSSGDFLFLFTTWQGYVIILLAILTLFFLVGMDINALVILCGRILGGEKPNVLFCIKEGFLSLRRFLNPRGLVIVLYLSLLSPILGFGVSISLTQNLYIPKFITSVIYSKPLYLIGVGVVFAALIFLGVIFMFILHGTLLDQMSLKESGRNSVRLIRKNLKDFIKNIILFFVLYFLVIVIVVALFFLIVFVKSFIPLSESANLPVSMAITLVADFLILFILAFFLPFYLLKLTMLYKRYQSAGGWEYQKKKNRKSPLVIAVAIGAVLAIVGITSFVTIFGETLFPNDNNTVYIAHRAGGSEAPENTAAGVDAAYRFGASGSEIDIQRTSDGYYVVNHDANFKRTAGVDKKPSEMTLAQVKELRVDGEPVPTLEEMLEACRGRVTLYVELKGETADEQMAEDAVRIIKEYQMEDEAVLISLKYNLIDYIETNYPEMETGYLAFASFGDTASLNCDSLALEEETATDDMILSIHEKGKKIFVWTVNDYDDLYTFLNSDADGIITDNIAGAKQVTAVLKSRALLDRAFDGVLSFLFGR